MCRMRCEICHKRLLTYQRLVLHYVSNHSKCQLAREIFKLTVRNIMPKIMGKKRQLVSPNQTYNTDKTETVFSKDSVQILYRNSDIIIRDEKSIIDMEFSFDENSEDVNENYATKKISDKIEVINRQDIINNENIEKKQLERATVTTMENATNLTSPSSTSSEDSPKKFSFKQRIRRKRDTRDKARHYKVNITRLKNSGFLDEVSGNYYECHCKGITKEILNSTKIKSESDTESASETGKVGYSNEPKVFCSKCGNGYKEDSLLLEHMKVHEKQCRVCNEIFQTDVEFKVHIQSHTFQVFVCHICSYEFPAKQILEKHFEGHLEQSVLESVLDMEEDYKISQCPVPNIPYQTCIDSIINYLEKPIGPRYNGSTSSRSLMNCAICFAEMSRCDFNIHMQNVHRIYGHN